MGYTLNMNKDEISLDLNVLESESEAVILLFIVLRGSMTEEHSLAQSSPSYQEPPVSVMGLIAEPGAWC